MSVPANTNVQVPAHIAARIAARQQNSAAKSAMMASIVGDGISYPRVSIRAGRYRLVEAGVETVVGVTLDAIIVGANPNTSKIFYDKAFDSNAEGVRPTCFSNDGIKPDPSVENPISQGCAGCPHNQLGSKVLPSGAKSKICADQRHMAIIAAADPTKVYSLTVPVSGMKALREYFKDMQNFGMEPQEVVTELGFDDQASFPKITFKRKGFVPEAALPKVEAMMVTDEVKECTRVIPPRQRNALSAPAAQAALATANQPVDDAYEDVPAPAAQPAAVAEEAPTTAPKAATKAKPTVEPVKASSELEAKLDGLFG